MFISDFSIKSTWKAIVFSNDFNLYFSVTFFYDQLFNKTVNLTFKLDKVIYVCAVLVYLCKENIYF